MQRLQMVAWLLITSDQVKQAYYNNFSWILYSDAEIKQFANLVGVTYVWIQTVVAKN